MLRATQCLQIINTENQLLLLLSDKYGKYENYCLRHVRGYLKQLSNILIDDQQDKI